MTQNTSESDGKISDTGEQVTVSRQVSHPIKSVWNFLMTDDGAEALLGPGGRLGDKGHTWQAQDGSHGVTRSFHPLEQIRFSWHRDAEAPSSVVDLHLSQAGDSETRLDVVQNHLPDDADRTFLQQHWADALERIDAHAV